MPLGPENIQALLRVENLAKHYQRASVFDPKEETTGLCGVSLSIAAQTTVALVGESGSGKSTLALCVAGLERPTSGKIWLGAQEITSLSEEELRAVRPKIQLVFQDPTNSLNPRRTALEIVSEPLLIHKKLDRNGRREQAYALIERLGIPLEKANQRPGEFSGGQRQRLAIARALALEAQVLILDEALSALDCSVQAQIVNLLLNLQSSLGLSYLFITHDFRMAAHLAHRIVVMDHGRIVETGKPGDLVRTPKHDATQRLIAAATASQPALPALQVA
jgi:ABC-type glutathione transport system ATPase component